MAKAVKKTSARAKPGKKKSTESYHHGDLRAALLKAGLDILRREGAHRLSLREAARKVGVSHMAPYRHFPDKEALMAAIAQDGFSRLSRRLQEAVSPIEDPATKLEQAGVTYVEFALQDTEHLRVMFGGFVSDRKKYPPTREAALKNFEVLVGILKELQERGLVAKEDPARQALAAWASVHGIAMLLIENQLQWMEIDRSRAEAVARDIVRTVIAGLKVPQKPA